MQRSLFDLPLPSSPPAGDVCENRHGGNPESRAALVKAAPGIGKAHADILAWLKRVGRGTAKQYAVARGKPLNAISGRFAELKHAGTIRRVADRERIDGAAVLEVST